MEPMTDLTQTSRDDGNELSTNSTKDTVDSRDAELARKEAELAHLQAQMDILMRVVDQGQLQREMLKKHGEGKKETEVTLHMFNGKLVKGWSKLLTNKVYRDGSGRRIEDQTFEVYYYDEEEPDIISIEDRANMFEPTPALTVIGTRTDEKTGAFYYKVVYEGVEREINALFVN